MLTPEQKQEYERIARQYDPDLTEMLEKPDAMLFRTLLEAAYEMQLAKVGIPEMAYSLMRLEVAAAVTRLEKGGTIPSAPPYPGVTSYPPRSAPPAAEQPKPTASEPPTPRRYVVSLDTQYSAPYGLMVAADPEVYDFIKLLSVVGSTYEIGANLHVRFDPRYAYDRASAEQCAAYLRGELEKEFAGTTMPPREQPE